ncbi:MAG: hypothetical protein IH614_14675, partial [Desulfuromonadales bacterium]|nr:hypothetical protein [Desulfuromonadales bacterium]
MSSILKALRKLEEERALRREGSIDIARDILRRPASRPRRSAWRLGWLSALAVILLGVAGWGLSLVLAPVPRGIFPPPHSAVVVTETTAGIRSGPASSTVEPTGLLAGVGAEPEVVTELLGEDFPARPAVDQRQAVPTTSLAKGTPPPAMPPPLPRSKA